MLWTILVILLVLWLIGFFILRNGWFSLFEMGSRGATPGKRMLGLRVVARDGARLTGAASHIRSVPCSTTPPSANNLSAAESRAMNTTGPVS